MARVPPLNEQRWHKHGSNHLMRLGTTLDVGVWEFNELKHNAFNLGS